MSSIFLTKSQISRENSKYHVRKMKKNDFCCIFPNKLCFFLERCKENRTRFEKCPKKWDIFSLKSDISPFLSPLNFVVLEILYSFVQHY